MCLPLHYACQPPSAKQRIDFTNIARLTLLSSILYGTRSVQLAPQMRAESVCSTLVGVQVSSSSTRADVRRW